MDNGEKQKLHQVAEDVAYIKGKVDSLPCFCQEDRIQDLEKAVRNQNIFGIILGTVLAVWAWLNGKS